MIGAYDIEIYNEIIHYTLRVKRNITILTGNSGTGKTTLVDLIAEFNEFGEDSGITLNCAVPCIVVNGKNWKEQIARTKQSIVFIDEHNSFLRTAEFAGVIKGTDNYYVLVTRESLKCLPYSVNEIYEIRNDTKYSEARPAHNVTKQLFTTLNIVQKIKPSVIITEDARSGNQFFSYVCKNKGLICDTAEGKDNIANKIKVTSDIFRDHVILLIVDGAAFGANMVDTMLKIHEYPNYILYAPESFEWLLLKSGLVTNVTKDNAIDKILDDPTKYIDSIKYFSWEEYFHQLIYSATRASEIFTGAGLKYDKKKLKHGYFKDSVVNRVIDIMKKSGIDI